MSPVATVFIAVNAEFEYVPAAMFVGLGESTPAETVAEVL